MIRVNPSGTIYVEEGFVIYIVRQKGKYVTFKSDIPGSPFDQIVWGFDSIDWKDHQWWVKRGAFGRDFHSGRFKRDEKNKLFEFLEQNPDKVVLLADKTFIVKDPYYLYILKAPHHNGTTIRFLKLEDLPEGIKIKHAFA